MKKPAQVTESDLTLISDLADYWVRDNILEKDFNWDQYCGLNLHNRLQVIQNFKDRKNDKLD